MERKTLKTLRTLRLKSEDVRLVEAYLKANPAFESFSSLTRTALLTFIQSKHELALHPIESKQLKEGPSFLWEFALSKAELKQILSSTNLKEKRAFMGKILSEAPFEEVWEYLSIQDIEENLSALRLPPKIKSHWELALDVWKNT